MNSDLAGHLAPLVANAALEVEGLAKGRVALSDAARRGLGEALGKRLGVACGAVLRHMIGAGAIGETASEASWGAVFAAYPGLVPIVEQMIGGWRQSTVRFLERYAADAELLGDRSATLKEVAAAGGGLHESPTLRVTTGAGQAYYYKDRSQAIGAWLAELVRRLNDCGPRLPLYVRRIEARAGYGWDAAVAAAECANAEEAERYYVRIGMWLRLFEALAGQDLGAENLVAAGEHPVPIDCESLFPLRGTATNALGAARQARQRSVLEPGLLPLAMPRMMPVVAGRAVHPSEHIDAIRAGFDSMQVLLHGRGAPVFEAMLAHAVACEVRVARRPDFETRRVIDASLAPEVLAEPGARATLIAAQAHAEDRDAIADVELPRHYAWPDISVAGTLRSHAEIERDRAMIATAIGCSRAAIVGVGVSVGVGAGVGVGAAAGEDELVNAATEIGDRLLGEGHGDRASLHWLGVVWNPFAGEALIDVLPNDLLSGNAGLAVMFAALHRVTDEARFADAARRTLGPVVRALIAPTIRGAWRPWGAYLGSAGQVYALERVGELLDQPVFAQPVIEELLLAPSGGIDLAAGTAGMVAVAARGPTAPDWCVALGDVLRATMDARPALPYADGHMPAYLPDAATGIAHALTRLARTPGNQRFAEDIAPRDPGWWDVGDADALMQRHAATGTWFPESGLADRLNVGGMLGIGAVALALLRKAAPEAGIPSLWRLD